MRVAHLSTSDSAGGAARAAYRLHRGLAARGVDSRMLVLDKRTADASVTAVSPAAAAAVAAARRMLTNGPLRLYPRRNRAGVFSLQWVPGGAAGALSRAAPDVVNLHWVGAGFLSIESVGRIVQPVVWTLHDMWPFTGGCHYAEGCDRFQERCGACPVLGSSRVWDASRWVHRRKRRAWRRPLRIVAPSRWLAGEAGRSSLFSAARIDVIPYGVDTALFAPGDRRALRAELGLPAGKLVVLFGAARALDDPRKGFGHLAAALGRLPAALRNDLQVVVVGAAARRLELDVAVDFRGEVTDDRTLAALYAAADVFAAPSVEENLSCMVLEALAAGTPCAAFAVGGMPDMIVPGETGRLARPYDAESLAAELAWLFADRARLADLGRRARERALAEYSLDRQAARYAALYREVLEAPPGF